MKTKHASTTLRAPSLASLVGALCVFASLSAATRAHGGFAVTETSDWSNNLATPFVISAPLGTGVNTITGTLPAQPDFFASFTADIDVFQVKNPSGLTIGGITLEISDFVADGTNRGRLEILSPSTGAVNFASNGFYVLPAIVNDASTLGFRIYAPGQFTPQGSTAGSANYKVTINAVPEPSAALLVLAGTLGAFTVLRRSKR